MKNLIDANLLEHLTSSAVLPAPQPPHALMETGDHYSIFLNLLGIDRNDIAVALNERSRELTVLARRDRERVRTGFFWNFNVPRGGELSRIQMRYRNGAVEIRIPKMAA